MKAFLSHSSDDKEFVKAVAQELGRQICILDEQAFSSGTEFRQSIEEHLDNTSIFVLFYSKSAKKSIWVEFEQDEAWYKKLEGRIKKTLVYIIDSSINLDTDLPAWLKRGKITTENAPKIVARDIRYHLNASMREQQPFHFFNRDSEKQELIDYLKPIDLSTTPPKVIIIHGLPGIGRRTFIRECVPTILNLKKFVEIRIESGDSLNDICTKIADQTEPYNTDEGFKRIISEIQNLPEEDALLRLLKNLSIHIANGTLPICTDGGGLLNDDGHFHHHINKLLNAVTASKDLYLFLASHRKPQNTEQYFPAIQLHRLPEKETKRFTSALARDKEMDLSMTEINEISEYTKGYPPAVYFSIQEAKAYGIGALLKSKNLLVNFRTTLFLKHIAKTNLNTKEQELLMILAYYSPLPIKIIIKILNVDDSIAVEMILRLIGYSFITATNDGNYRIADPLSESATKAFGIPSAEYANQIATHLSEYLSEGNIDTKRLEISRVLFRASKLANNKNAEKVSIRLCSDLIKLAKTSYDSRNYGNAILYGKEASKERPNNTDIRTLLIRAYIKKEEWETARKEIKKLEEQAPIRDSYFLQGFLERNRGNLGLALEHYRKAENLGRADVAIKREIADCELQGNNIDEASRIVNKLITGRHGDNVFIVDMWAEISMRKNNSSETEKALDQLRLLDKSRYHFRKSRYCLQKSNPTEAVSHAKKAIENEKQNGSKAPFKFHAQLINSLIKSRDIDEARARLTKLDHEFKNIQNDIRTSLKCSLENASGHYSESLRLSEYIADKETFYYKKIRKEAIEGRLRVSALNDSSRAKLHDELAELKAEQMDGFSDDIPFH